MKKTGFTLVEMLLTLTIIGVIASITIPSLINDTDSTEYKALYKKTYYTLAETTKTLIQDNAGSLNGVWANGDTDAVVNSYRTHLTSTKMCTKGNVITEGCWHSSMYNYNGEIYPSMPAFSSGSSGTVLENGMLLLSFENQVHSTCKPLSYCARNDFTCQKNNVCGSLLIDINGIKSPNKMGVDIFYYAIFTDSLAPWYKDDCTKNPTFDAGGGWGCGQKLMLGENY